MEALLIVKFLLNSDENDFEFCTCVWEYVFYIFNRSYGGEHMMLNKMSCFSFSDFCYLNFVFRSIYAESFTDIGGETSSVRYDVC